MKKNFFRSLVPFSFLFLFSFLILPSSAASAGKVFKQVWKNNLVYGQEQRFSDDGTKVIVISDGASGSIIGYINYISILDALSGKILHQTIAMGSATISHDGKYLAVMLPISSGEISTTISLYDTQNFEFYKEIPLPYTYKSYLDKKVFFSADDKDLYTSVFVRDSSGTTPYPAYGWSKFLVLNIESLERKEIELGYGDHIRLDNLLVSKDGKYYVVKTGGTPSNTKLYDASTHTVLGYFSFVWSEKGSNGISRPVYSSPMHLSFDNKLYIGCKEKIWINMYKDEYELIPHIEIFDLDAGGKLVNDCIPPNICSRITFLDSGNCLFGTDYKSETKENKYLFYSFLNCEPPEKSPFIWATPNFYDYYTGYYLAKSMGSIGGVEVYTIDSISSVSSSPSAMVSNLFVNKELLRFTLFLPSFSHCLIKIFDNNGKELCVVAEGDYVGENVFSYNIQDFPSGVYFLRVNDESFKFIVAR